MVDATRYPPYGSECLAHWPCSGKSTNNWEPSAAPKRVTRHGGEPNLSPKTCVSCALLSVNSLISYIALNHCLDPFILRHPVHVCGLLSLAWLPDFSGSVISSSSQLSRPDKSIRLLFFSPSQMFALLIALGFAIWTLTAIIDITSPFHSCFWIEAKGRRENKNITLGFFWGQRRLTHVMCALQTQCWLLLQLKVLNDLCCFQK